MKRILNKGFTMIELLMVILLVAILSAVAIPQFLDFRTEGRNAATQNALGSIRTGVATQYSQSLLRCGATAGQWPEQAALAGNDITAGTICSAAEVVNTEERKFVAGPAIPVNPWGATPPVNTITACAGAACTATNKCAQQCDGSAGTPTGGGWCYDPADGEVWANSASNPTTDECSY